MHRCIGEDLWNKLEHKHILECGCGAGRFTEIFLAKGAYVTSMDLSKAVDANQENFPQAEAHRIAQADILRLPFLQQQYDVVFCLGVIQHTPHSGKTLSCLYNQVKPGGTLVIDHYTYNLSFFTKTAPLLRFFFSRIPPTKCMRMIEKLVDILFPLHKMAKRFYPIQVILSRVSPIRTYHYVFPELNDELQKEWALLDTYDSLTARYRHLRSLQFIRKRLMDLGLEEIRCSYGGNGVEARGKRPLAL